MKPLFNCELTYVPSIHLNQLYDGFEKLSKKGVINLSYITQTTSSTEPILKVLVDNKYNLIYDTYDGFNWTKGSLEENLNFFKKHIKADFYFKRSYIEDLSEYHPENCKVYPLGLNYNIKPEGRLPKGFNDTIKDSIKNNYFYSKIHGKTSFKSDDFEFYPISSEKNKILFLTRLWDPNEVSSEDSKNQRELINKNRVECIEACKNEFNDKFIGGLQRDEFSLHNAKKLIMPSATTKKEEFLKTIKRSNICIGTTGLHNSIGWKFGEYVAASRAIVSEPLNYMLPGIFENGKNFLEYLKKDELIENIYLLLNSKEKLNSMMYYNYHYYNNYVRPDSLILNTLIKVYKNG